MALAFTLIAAWAIGPSAILSAPPAQEAVIVVTSTADSGPGSLREVLERATPGTTITFDPAVFPPGSPVAIMLTSEPLPDITQGNLTIDASNAGVILDGGELTEGPGILIESDGNVIKGLQILSFPDNGIWVGNGASNNLIGGSNATPGGACSGECNLISGNGVSGVRIEGSDTMGNTVSGNYIGTDATGTAAKGNANHGIDIGYGARNNLTGGNTPGERNLISGNGEHGVWIGDSGTMYNTVSGNYIGTNASGTAAIPNGNFGVNLAPSAQHNLIGGDTATARNLISGNGSGGVNISGSGVVYNTVSGNYIGTDATGSAAISNTFHGVAVVNGAQYNLIGGDTADEGNLISGNGWDGVFIHDSGTMSNTVSGNYIGTNTSGTAAVPNGNFGVNLGNSAQNNLIGGNSAAERNLISGNGNGGVNISGSGVMYNTVSGNYIGTDATGSAAIGNTVHGVTISVGAQKNLVGGDTAGERNIISGNGSDGVRIEVSDAMSNTVSGNYIGTDASGMVAIPNAENGVSISDGASYNLIGGETASERNLISGNGNVGVRLSGSGTTSNTVSGNYIGTDVNGTSDLGNGYEGVSIDEGASNNTIGGSNASPSGACTGECNLLSGNDGEGVWIGQSGTVSNTVSGNYIGTDVNGVAVIGNQRSGIHIENGGSHNVIGGDTPGERNLISGNSAGVSMAGNNTMSNTVSGNYIGTDVSGRAAISSAGVGVWIGNGASGNTIGPGNVVAYNDGDGIRVYGPDSLRNSITQNSVHDNAEMGIVLWDGGNAELPPPVISYIASRVVRGTAPPNSTVEVFSDDADEGKVFEGNTTVDLNSEFAFIKRGAKLAGPNITATATDEEGNTSEFSDPELLPKPKVLRELPDIPTPAEISVEPKVVGTNLGLAVFCALFFGLTSSVFNATLSEYRDEIQSALLRFIPLRVRTALAGLAVFPSRLTRGGFLAGWLFFVSLTAAVESFLDPELGLFSLARLSVLATLVIAAIVVNAVEFGANIFIRRRLAPKVEVEGKVHFIGLAIALACVALSRGVNLKPGYLFGAVGALYLIPELVEAAKSAERAIAVMGAVLIAGLLCWVTTAFLPGTLVELQPVLLTIFLISLQGVFFNLFPLAVTDGGDIYNWKRGIWLACFVAVLFPFYHFILNPNASDVKALQQGGVITLLILLATYGLATLTLYLLFPVRLRRVGKEEADTDG